MKLQTKIPFKKQSKNQIDYNSNILLIGSCFSENIGKKLDYFKFKNSQNPFGILFHPKAIETLCLNAANQKEYSDKDVFFHNEQWHCFEAHSKLSSRSKEDLLSHLNRAVKLTNRQIQESTHIIITLGTAWAYRFNETNQIVANCHKVPQKQFTKQLLSVDEVSSSLQTIVDLVKKVNPEVSIIFTISPVRHIKDGFIENTQSKAHLIAAIGGLIPSLGPDSYRDKELYFPSYEIMMDELRDYRFYVEDMIHPNQTAINYIWDKFQLVWISDDASKIMDKVDAVQKGLQHKPFNENSQAHLKFLQNLEAQKNQLQSLFPHMIF